MFLTSWQILWHHDVFLTAWQTFDIFLTLWRTFGRDDVFYVMTNFFTSWQTFWHHDVFLTSWQTFDVMTSPLTSWRVFDVITNFLASWRVFDFMITCWHHDIFFSSWRTFWSNDEPNRVLTIRVLYRCETGFYLEQGVLRCHEGFCSRLVGNHKRCTNAHWCVCTYWGLASASPLNRVPSLTLLWLRDP